MNYIDRAISRFPKTPQWLKNRYPRLIWDYPVAPEEKTLYLTFDDGPTPEVTPWVLDQLDAHDAKATFFCIGAHIQRYPDIYAETKRRGHLLGNHTYRHVNGWKTPLDKYALEVKECGELVNSLFFRPPYGRLSYRQIDMLFEYPNLLIPQTKTNGNAKTSKPQIIMWDIVSSDFNQFISAELCTKNVINHARSGSIVVFHDSQEAWGRLKPTLPKVLAHFSALGYQFKTCFPFKEN